MLFQCRCGIQGFSLSEAEGAERQKQSCSASKMQQRHRVCPENLAGTLLNYWRVPKEIQLKPAIASNLRNHLVLLLEELIRALVPMSISSAFFLDPTAAIIRNHQVQIWKIVHRAVRTTSLKNASTTLDCQADSL